MSDTTPRLLVGPVLRYVDEHNATVWVETDRACTVDILGTTAPTWSVNGHHYALVLLEGLDPGSEYPYEVHLDGARVWPEPDSPYPPSVIRTLTRRHDFRLAFGSCRRAAPFDKAHLRTFGADALVALAERMATGDHDGWPDALFLAGDQIYADMASDELSRRLDEAHADADEAHADVRNEIWNFEEYTWLYHESWTPAPVRWLLSTVPSCMMLDDHDLRDDWNTSVSWRESVTTQPWWRDRVVGAFASYWVYQHLGNLSPEHLATDKTFEMVTTVKDDAERTRLLDEFAWLSDAQPDSSRWSFSRDFGSEELVIRMVAVDSRCARRLDPDNRSMVDDAEWRWLVEQATTGPEGRRIDHLFVGSTLPFLLLHGIHHLEGWDEAVSEGAWGRRASVIAEAVRQAFDLEHWSAFRGSFQRVVELLELVCASPEPPASILLLSGDVHCSYTASARLQRVEHPDTAIHQLTMSPFRNPLHFPLRLANRAFELPGVRNVFHALARSARVEDVVLDWSVDGGPWFENGLMTIVVGGRDARVEIDHATTHGTRQLLRRTETRALTR